MSEPQKRAGKPRVIVIDDEEHRQKHIRRLLGESARVSSARTAGQAIGMLRRDCYDVVLLDYDLSRAPEGYDPQNLSGMDVARMFVGLPNRKSIVVVTSHGLSWAEEIAGLLEKNGVDVRRCRFSDLTEEFLAEVLADVAEEASE